MNSFADISLCDLEEKTIRLLYNLDSMSFTDVEHKAYISEGLLIMGRYCRDIALHCMRVAYYANAIGKELKISSNDKNLLWCSSILHDIGKIKIPIEILHKPDKLTAEEYEIVKTHSHIGYEIVNLKKGMHMVSDILLYHHERFDGMGYPIGIQGRDLPLLSRIIAVADAFDAMTTERPYKKAIPTEIALNELCEGKWTQFDGDIVDCFKVQVENNYNIQTGLKRVIDYV